MPAAVPELIIAKSRGQRDELIETNRQIGRNSAELAQLLEQRTPTA